MTALVDRLEQLHAEATAAPWLQWETGPWEDGTRIAEIIAPDNAPAAIQYPDGSFTLPDAALIVELRNALPALLTALRAAQRLDATFFGWDVLVDLTDDELALHEALVPLFGEDTTP